MEIRTTEPLAQALTSAILAGDVDTLRHLLDGDPLLSKARIVDPKGTSRTLLHIAVDWPGHFPKVVQTIGLLIERAQIPRPRWLAVTRRRDHSTGQRVPMT